ncbi:MAG: hypothetical protein GC152_16190 [Alphaproteobacteria bacterium]|nr:hypothetical protein [Alphaproteobacteria bacterium]
MSCVLIAALVSFAKADEVGGRAPCAAGAAACDGGLRLNDIQAAGSHNSYKIAIPAYERRIIALTSAETAAGLDYSHVPIPEQLDLGMRQLELDVFHDPEGGRYEKPLLPRISSAGRAEPTWDSTGMDAPGLKVLHIQDIDIRSHCNTFVLCLRQIKAWSDRHRDHAPILVLINAKDAEIAAPGAVKPLAFDAAAYDRLDAEIRSVFPRRRLIVPDDVRGDAPTLRDGAMNGGWPTLSAARGRVMFALDETPAKVNVYRRGARSLEGAACFVNTYDENAPDAAYFTMNDPLSDGEAIARRVRDGFIVRTRADADTIEARTNDTSRRDAAFRSGAHYVSTDYYHPREEWSGYSARLPGDAVIRCNPVRAAPACAPAGGADWTLDGEGLEDGAAK